MIRVLIVEDSPLVAQILKEVMENDPQIGVVGIAGDGIEAFQLTKKLKPDVITMDIHMPRMDGFEATKQIMAYAATPILILSSSVFKDGTEKAFKALSYGAVDVLEKNSFDRMPTNIFPDDRRKENELIEKVKLISRVKVISHPLAKMEERLKPHALKIPASKKGMEGDQKIVGIVASTGGPQVLLSILKMLPQEFPYPIVIVQHISAGFTEGLVEWLDRETFLTVKMAAPQDKLEKGTVYVAPPLKHMLVTSYGTLALTDDKPVDGQKPSGTVLFESIAKVYGAKALGVILTGMGSDGATGLKMIHEAKGRTLVQDERSSTIYGMPRMAVDMGGVDEILAPEQIAAAIIKWVVK